jgi:hypothetical protein
MMRSHRRLVASNDGLLTKPPRFNRERLLAFARAMPGAAAAFLLWPLRVLRYVAYLVLLFLRIPVRLVCYVALVPLILGAVVWGFIKGWTSLPTVVMGGSAFALFVASFLYDSLLLLIAPERIYLDM